MKITSDYAACQFDYFNHLCFDGSLLRIPIVLSRASSYLGKLCYKVDRHPFRDARNRDFSIRLSSAFDLTESQWQDVIIHEMIHYYIAFNHIKDTSSHGVQFRRIMGRINSLYGRNIEVSHKVSLNSIHVENNVVRTHFVCVSTFYDGEKGVTVCSATMQKEIDAGLPECYSLRERKWYISFDVYFNRFPHSRLPRIYSVDEKELEEHLKDGIEVWG